MPLIQEPPIGRVGHGLHAPQKSLYAPEKGANQAPEKKSADLNQSAVRDVRDAMHEFMHRFDAFKQANDTRLREMERKQSADIVTVEKVDRLNAALDHQQKTVDSLTLNMKRPSMSGTSDRFDPAAHEHKTAFDTYVRRGETASLRHLEGKALSAQSDPDGGYLVPSETERLIDRIVSEASPIRAIAGVRQIGAASYKKPFATSGAATGWVGETEARPQTATPSIAELEFPVMELYAMPAATSTLLDDAAVNIDQWLAEEVQTAFAEQEGAAFVNGNGVHKPRGFLSYTNVANDSWSWGNVGYVATGVSGNFPVTNPSDRLLDLVYSVKSGYRANANFVMNRQTQAQIRKFKDADGVYLWQPSASAGEAPRLMNVPIAEAEDMPDVAADSFAIAYGDFRRGYLIVDRLGVRVLRDPYTAKPYVLFYTTKRVGGGVQNFEAIKLLKFSAS
ncbi:MAG: phage major capsid protein [Parvibaculum sp.]